MTLLSILDALSETRLGVVMRDSTWAFATVEIVHLVAMAFLGGAILFLDLRLMKLAFTSQPEQRVARDLLPYTVAGAVIMAATGTLLWLAGPVHYFLNTPFRFKMALFLFALIVHFGVHIRVAREEQFNTHSPHWYSIAAVLSLLLWCGTGIAGRAIGYF